VPLYDDNGAYSGMMAAELIARGGGEQIVSPERMFAPEVGGMNHVPYATAFAEHNVRVTINTRLKSVRRECNGLVATLGSDFSDKATIKGRVAQVVVEHGTVPMDDLYRELKPLSRKLGASITRRCFAVRTPPRRKPRCPLRHVPHRRCRRQPQHPRGHLRCLRDGVLV